MAQPRKCRALTCRTSAAQCAFAALPWPRAAAVESLPRTKQQLQAGPGPFCLAALLQRTAVGVLPAVTGVRLAMIPPERTRANTDERRAQQYSRWRKATSCARRRGNAHVQLARLAVARNALSNGGSCSHRVMFHALLVRCMPNVGFGA